MVSKVWIDANERLLKELSLEEKEKFLRVGSQGQLQTLLSRLKEQKDALCQQQVPNRLDKVAALLRPVALVANVLAQGMGIPSSLLWGAFGLVVEMGSSKLDFLDVILKSYEALLTALPRFQSYTAVLPNSPTLRLAIEQFFDAYVSLSLRCIKAFGRGRFSILTKIRWIRDQHSYEMTLNLLSKMATTVQAEAGFALEQQNQQLDNQRHQQLLSKQQELLSAINAETTASPKLENRTQKFNLPYSKNSSFHGRQDQLENMYNNLRPTAPDANNSQKVVALCGLGGVGKSQLALEYAYRYKQSYHACFWVTCDSTIKAAQGYAEIARTLGYSEMGDVQNHVNVKEWLCSTEDNWLLIYDNVESVASLADLWPASNQGSIIITSQDASWLVQEHIGLRIRLQPFELQEGVAMLESILDKQGQSISNATAKQIVQETSGLPLAIRQIGYYMCATESDPAEFLKIYQDHSSSLKIDEWSESSPPWYSHTLATFLNFAFGHLSEEAIFLLGLISFLDPDKIQEELFTSANSQNSIPLFGSLARYKDAMNKLRRYSLISTTRIEGSSIFSVHRQVKRHIRHRLTSAQLQETFEWTLERLRQLFPRQSPYAEPLNDRIPECGMCISHIIALNQAVTVLKDSLQQSQMMAQLLQDGATYLWARGLLQEGKSLTIAAKNICEHLPECDQLLIGEVYSFHACILSDSGDVNQAFEYFQKSAENRRQHLQRLRQVRQPATMIDEILLANAYNNLAGIYCARGDFSNAELHNELSLGLKKRWQNQQNLGYLLSLSYHNMALVNARQGKFEVAAGYFEQALAISEPNESTIRRALTYHNYGSMRLAQGQVTVALRLLETAFQLRWESLGDHYDTAASLHMLASCYQALNDKDSLKIASELLIEALRVLKSRPSSIDQRRIARTQYKLSLILHDLGDKSAKDMQEEARQLGFGASGGDLGGDGEEVFDNLVAYV